MDYRDLGRTGLRVSVVGYGASPLGGVFGPVDETSAIRAVHETLDAGVNFIDVSPYYGLTVAETVLGKALHGIRATVRPGHQGRPVRRRRVRLLRRAGRRSVDESLHGWASTTST